MFVLYDVSGMLIKYDKNIFLKRWIKLLAKMMNGAWKDVFCVVCGEFGVHDMEHILPSTIHHFKQDVLSIV
jgi:hypothetical protein